MKVFYETSLFEGYTPYKKLGLECLEDCKFGGSGQIRHRELYSMLSLVRDFSEYEEIFRPEINFKKMNVSDDLLISPVSYDEVLAFLLLMKARNSRLLTGRIVCLS